MFLDDVCQIAIKEVYRVHTGRKYSLAEVGTRLYGWGSNEKEKLKPDSRNQIRSPEMICEDFEEVWALEHNWISKKKERERWERVERGVKERGVVRRGLGEDVGFGLIGCD